MPILQTSEVFSEEAQGYISKFGAKAGLLRMIREKCPNLVNNILDGTYVSPDSISHDEVKRVIGNNNVTNPFLRSSHPDDGVGYIGRLDNIQLPEHASHGCFTNIGLNEYAKRLGYLPSFKTGLYIQEQIHYDDAVFGNLVEDPHNPGIFYISGRKKLDFGTFASVSKYGGKIQENIFSKNIQTEIVKMYQMTRESGFMNKEIAGQMEFAADRDGSIKLLQFRAFRKKEEANWNLDRKAMCSSEGTVFGITPEEGAEVNMGNSEGEFIDDSITGFHKRDYDRWNNVNPDVPLEKMKLITADPGLSPFEHGLFEIASLAETAIFSQFGSFDFPHIDIFADGKLSLNCRFFSDGQNFRIDIED